MVYRRRELWLLLVLATSLGVGLAIREFKSGFPDLADRLENLDTPTPSDGLTPASPAGFPARPQKISDAQTKLDGPLNLNRATPDDLRRLPGVGPMLAGQIIRARERQGRFAAPDDLLTVPGMGSKKFERIRDLVTVQE